MRDLDAATRWRALPETELLWEPLGADWMVFSRLSGQTHFLNATGALVLKQLQASPDTLHGTCARLCRTLGIDATPALRERIGAILEEFHQGGLICPLPP